MDFTIASMANALSGALIANEPEDVRYLIAGFLKQMPKESLEHFKVVAEDPDRYFVKRKRRFDA